MISSLRVAVLVVALAGCETVRVPVPFQVESVEFNDLIQPPLFLDLDPATLGTLHRSECLWTASGNTDASSDHMAVAWEVVYRLNNNNEAGQLCQPSDDHRVGACSGEHPLTGQPPTFCDPEEGDHVAVPLGLSGVSISQAWQLAPNVRNECGPADGPLQQLSAIGDCPLSDTGFFSDCGLKCTFVPPGSVSYSLQHDSGASRSLKPHVRPIYFPLRLSRKLTRHPDLQLSDNEVVPYVFDWAVPVASGDAWTENFSPNLHVSSVRVFREEPGKPKKYLSPRLLQMGITKCRPQLDPTVFVLARCSNDPLRYSPAYQLDGDGTRVDWHVGFSAEPEAGGELFIEFTVASTLAESGPAMPAFTPSEHTFDYMPVNTTATGRFALTNFGGATRIDDIFIDGTDAGEFEDQHPALPMNLGPHEIIDIQVIARPTSLGWKNAQLNFLTNGGLKRGAPIRVESVRGPTLMVLPGTDIELPRRQSLLGETFLSYRAPLQLSNVSLYPVTRASLSIVGRDASKFSLVPSATSNMAALLAARTLAPGESEHVGVEWTAAPAHDPTDPTYRAELVVSSDGGNTTVRLIGDPRLIPAAER